MAHFIMMWGLPLAMIKTNPFNDVDSKYMNQKTWSYYTVWCLSAVDLSYYEQEEGERHALNPELSGKI